MNPTPFFSIVIPVFNRAGSLAGALESVFAQRSWECGCSTAGAEGNARGDDDGHGGCYDSDHHGGYEVIVVDDGSSDDTAAVAARYRERGATLLTNGRNLGVGPTRNKGVGAARGDWVLFFDSDSYLTPDALSILRSTIDACDDKVGVVFGRSEVIAASARPETVGGSRGRSSGVTGPAINYLARDLASDLAPSLNPYSKDVEKYADDKGASEDAVVSRRCNYAELLAADHLEEAMPVTRRHILLRFPFEEDPDSRRECGSLVWFGIGRSGYDFLWTRELVQLYELSPEGLSGRSYLAAHPGEMVSCNRKIIERFGEDLLRFNPKKLVALHQKTSIYCLMAGRRSCALSHARRAWDLGRRNPRTALILMLCWMGPGPRAARAFYTAASAVGA